jgi:hypothetical protein
MRPYIVFVLLVAMTGGLVALRLTREPTTHEVTVVPEGDAKAGATKAGKPAAKAGATKAGATKAGRPAAKAGATKAPKPSAPVGTGKKPVENPAAPKDTKGKAATKPDKPAPAKPSGPLMKRPLRVASLGWELIAPGVVANGGAEAGKGSLFTKERLPVKLRAFRTMDEVESALARGGADKLGADVAIVPLPSFVAAYERLRALKLQIFFVVGWSRGRDGMMASPNITLKRPPRKKRIDLVGRPGHPATFLSLYALDLAGIPPKRVRLIPPDDAKAKKAPFAARVRPLPVGASTERKFVVTTADATHLIPIVAVAPEGLTKKHKQALTTWGHVWLKGIEQLQQDVPGSARQVATLDNAPHALDLLKSLGQIDPAPLSDNARLVALSGRSAATLDLLFRLCWRIWRAAGVLSSPMPDTTPISVKIMTAAVHRYPAQAAAPPPPRRPGAAAALQSLLVYKPRARGWKDREFIEQVGFLAEVFSRAGLKVCVRGDLRRTRKLVEATRSRYDLPRPNRLEAVRRPGGRLVVELLTRQ